MGCGIAKACSGTKGYGSRARGAFVAARSGTMGKGGAEIDRLVADGGIGLEEASLGEDATDRGGVGPAGP